MEVFIVKENKSLHIEKKVSLGVFDGRKKNSKIIESNRCAKGEEAQKKSS